MVLLFSIFLLIIFPSNIFGQFTSQNYPDPRTEPLRCKLLLPGQICDPSDILNDVERRKLNEKIQQLATVTAQIRNTSPQCVGSPNQNLQIIVALLEKIGVNPLDPVDIERFTNSLRLKYLNFQELNCDTLVLIVNSRRDRQVFTVAGRDAKLSRDVLQTAFHRNIGHFRQGHYVLGLEGMVEYIVSSYTSTHIVQVPSPEVLGPTNSGIENTNFVAHGVRQKPEQKISPEKFDYTGIPEDDKVWVDLMIRAGGRCGYDPTKMTENIRAIVEEAMSISLKLISDTRYNKIEEISQDVNSGSGAREKAWADAKTSFIDSLYTQYKDKLPRKVSQCPKPEPSTDPTPAPSFGAFGFGK
uniref:Uncharacterized protein n=1 Tax=Panagrolaimus davidi TaxID=227884 RepID=A0A914Q8J6_9BILA